MREASRSEVIVRYSLIAITGEDNNMVLERNCTASFLTIPAFATSDRLNTPDPVNQQQKGNIGIMYLKKTQQLWVHCIACTVGCSRKTEVGWRQLL